MKGALLVLFSLVAANATARQPNIVLILADDLGYADIGAYGNPANQTPNLDRMAREGVRFTDFHTNGANCSPTRAAILTGRYQQRCGIEGALGEGARGLPQETITVAERLRDAGYATGMTGKWHLGYEPENGPTRHGFEEFVGHLHGATDYLSHVDKYGRMDWWHDEEPVNEDGHNTTLITRHSVRFIEKHAGRPFFLFVSHSAIHFPWQTTADRAHRVAGQRYDKGAVDKLGPHAAGPVQPVVQGMIEELDASVGEILKALEAGGIAEHTLVFFTSDNGGIVRMAGVPIVPGNRISDNTPWRGQKHGLYEGGHRVPAIAWWPGRLEAGRVSGELGMTADLMPTFLALADLEAGETDGVDLSLHLFKKRKLPERTLFWRNGASRAVRWGDWKLVRIHDRPFELYHLAENPAEHPKRDLIRDRAEIAEDLHLRLKAWETRVDGQ